MPVDEEKKESALAAELDRYAKDPVGFVDFAYPWGKAGTELENYPDGDRPWQNDILGVIGEHLRSNDRFIPLQIAVSSGHGIGKSALVGQVVHWALSTMADTRIVVTANTGDQLDTKTVPEISKWFRLAINSHWWQVGSQSIKARDAKHEKNWRADFLTWSLEKTESFAGLHNKGKRIVLIFDESSAIPDAIWEVAQGALTDEDTEIIFIVFGNPTLNTGRFRECFGKNRHRWITRQIDSRSVDGTNKAEIAKWIEDYGEDSDFVRIRVRGEFPRAGSTQLIPGHVVADARKRKVGDQSKAHMILSVDVARFGDDQTVIGYRQGSRAVILEKLRGLDTMQVAMRALAHIERLTPRAAIVDADGLGAGVIDYLRLHLRDWMDRRKWFQLAEFHGGAATGEPAAYYNHRAEVWCKMRDWLATAEIPDDPELDTDLTAPQYFYSAKNQIQLEKKEDMKKRGLASPDAGDMLAMTFGVMPVPKTRDEAAQEEIREMQKKDPTEAYFMALRERERQEKLKTPMNYWE